MLWHTEESLNTISRIKIGFNLLTAAILILITRKNLIAHRVDKFK